MSLSWRPLFEAYFCFHMSQQQYSPAVEGSFSLILDLSLGRWQLTTETGLWKGWIWRLAFLLKTYKLCSAAVLARSNRVDFTFKSHPTLRSDSRQCVPSCSPTERQASLFLAKKYKLWELRKGSGSRDKWFTHSKPTEEVKQMLYCLPGLQAGYIHF